MWIWFLESSWSRALSSIKTCSDLFTCFLFKKSLNLEQEYSRILQQCETLHQKNHCYRCSLGVFMNSSNYFNCMLILAHNSCMENIKLPITFWYGIVCIDLRILDWSKKLSNITCFEFGVDPSKKIPYNLQFTIPNSNLTMDWLCLIRKIITFSLFWTDYTLHFIVLHITQWI
jgi:hypothetical protein